jgi:hypothetical protein
MEDGGADGAREGIGLGGWWLWRVSLGGDWLCVEFFDGVDVGVIHGATEVEVVAHAMAVRNWLESAARWVVRLWPIDVRVLFSE